MQVVPWWCGSFPVQYNWTSEMRTSDYTIAGKMLGAVMSGGVNSNFTFGAISPYHKFASQSRVTTGRRQLQR